MPLSYKKEWAITDINNDMNDSWNNYADERRQTKRVYVVGFHLCKSLENATYL